ncbi:RNA polymerase sigma factor [Brevibacterium luteolum]|uniref:RNA polymerase sigma factor n=1 Tax=Brevibacterium luteolum TaxID=199591 RepID=UPI0021AF8C3C|nr:sigma-70 family RNA polymerase sigma factor [Brevibacterium luteolum]MCT1658302.1 sigma-70 family RNA polymerase sigma factor [Brevibacterium luteolum]MCT1922777.1 sigma-70 family RNA polymerase sigma factor [Brevibacterium luteolum]
MDPIVPDAADDHVLLSKIAAGDEGALAELYRRYASAVLSFTIARTSSREIAEEVSADVWVGCWRSASAFRGDSKVLTWLLGIAKRQIWAHTRRRPLAIVPLEDHGEGLVAADEDPAVVVSTNEGEAALVHALESLSPELTEVVTLAWVHDLPYDQVAEAVGIPIGTVKSRVSRARRLLRESLRRDNA